jgi:hypothetical protein
MAAGVKGTVFWDVLCTWHNITVDSHIQLQLMMLSAA